MRRLDATPKDIVTTLLVTMLFICLGAYEPTPSVDTNLNQAVNPQTRI